MLKRKEHSLGKGEVDSSILSGSTSNPCKTSDFSHGRVGQGVAIAQNGTRNAQPDSWKIGGLCSAHVRLTGPEWLGLATVLAWALIAILIALTVDDLHCRPGDTRTTNHTPICEARR